jgi:hypothetical protein
MLDARCDKCLLRRKISKERLQQDEVVVVAGWR